MGTVLNLWCPGCDEVEDLDMAADAVTLNARWRSLTGDGDSYICCKCWETMRPFERVLLTMLAGSYGPGRYAHLGVNDNLDEINATLGKMFHAQHGHGLGVVCNECDPEMYKRLQEFDRKRAELRSKGGEPK